MPFSIRPVRRSAILAAACCLVAGCGSGGDQSAKPKPLPLAAEPGVSPRPAVTPAGRVRRLDAFPEGVAVDPGTGRVAVGLRNPDRLAILDGASGRLLHRLVLPESPRHLLLGREPGVVLVPAERANELVRVDVRTERILSRVRVGTFPHGVIQTGRRIFVADELGGRISVVEGGTVIATLGGLTQPGGLAVAGGRLAVVDVRTRRLVVFDVRTLKRLADVPAGVGATHAVADREGEILVADTEGRALLVYRLAPTVRLVGRVPLPGTPYGIAIDPVHDQLWLSLTSSNRLLGFQLGDRGPRRIASYPTVRQPNTVAVDPASGRLFVASRTESQLETISRGPTPRAPG